MSLEVLHFNCASPDEQLGFAVTCAEITIARGQVYRVAHFLFWQLPSARL